MITSPQDGEHVAPAAPPIGDLIAERLRQRTEPVLAGYNATVLFDADGHGAWTIRLSRGAASVEPGSVEAPTVSVRASVEVLRDVIEGRRSGTQAYLDGDLIVRGHLALALELDGAFDTPNRPVTHPRARVATPLGVRTVYLDAGSRDAPAVVLLHGLGATNASMLPLVADLSSDHRVIAPDLPGFGDSAKPRWRYTPAQFARWLNAFQHAVGAPTATLVGNSMGGRITIEAGLQHPETVTRMVLLCPSPAFRKMRQMVPFVRVLSAQLARVPLPVAHEFVVDSVRNMFAVPDRLPNEWYDAAADEFRYVFKSPAARVAFFACARQIYLEDAFGDRGFWTRLPSLRTPAMFVWGERDRLVPAGFERHVREALPSVKSVTLPNCGHVPQFELREETARLVRDFIDAS